MNKIAIKDQVKAKDKLVELATTYKLKTFITLTYPANIYPKDESKVKLHLQKFINTFSVKNKENKFIYFYVYELQQNNNIHIHILTNREKKNFLERFVKAWVSAIGTSATQAVHVREINDILGTCLYCLKVLKKPKEVEAILKKLGKNSQVLSGTKEFAAVKELLYQNKLDIPINLDSTGKKSILQIRESLIQEYGGREISSNLIDNQLSLELTSYSETMLGLSVSDITDFMSTNTVPVSSGRNKYFKLLEILSKDLIGEYLESACQFFSKIKRETPITQLYRDCLHFDKDDLASTSSYCINVVRQLLDSLIKASCRKTNYITVVKQVSKQLLYPIEKSYTEEVLIKLGIVLVEQFKKVSASKIIFEKELQEVDKNSEPQDDIDLDNIEYSNEIVNFNFNEGWLEKQEKLGQKIIKQQISNFLVAMPPMCVPPRPWILGKKEGDLYSGFDVKKGGFLLNEFYFNKAIQISNSKGHKHSLSIRDSVVDVINKIQNTAYCVNLAQYDLLVKYKKILPEYHENTRELQKERKILYKKRQNAFKFIKKDKEEANKKGKLRSKEKIYEELDDVTSKLFEVTSKLTQHERLERVLDNFQEIITTTKLYYSYELDFRMRIYPQQTELSPQGSKLSRSLIKFQKKSEFNLREFKLYSTRLYYKIYNFTENDLYAKFEDLKEIFSNLVTCEETTIKQIFKEAAEPYLFLAACLEYNNYKEADLKNEKYYTGFPIILDCSSSGPQIMSLLRLREKFQVYLNLTDSERKYDFYIEIIKNFISEDTKLKEYNFTDEIYVILRKICKTDIMTQAYNIGYLNFADKLKRGFLDKSNKKYFESIKEYNTFIKYFTTSFWNYLQKLDLFLLRDFFKIFGFFLRKYNLPLSWPVFDKNKITADYMLQKHRKIDMKSGPLLVERVQHNYLEASLDRDYRKIIRSAQANFIHSYDAFINLYVLSKFKGEIYSNHDAWAVCMGKSEELRLIVSEGYSILAGEAFDNCILYFKKELRENVGEAAEAAFSAYCDLELKKGNLDIEKLKLSKFVCYFG